MFPLHESGQRLLGLYRVLGLRIKIHDVTVGPGGQHRLAQDTLPHVCDCQRRLRSQLALAVVRNDVCVVVDGQLRIVEFEEVELGNAEAGERQLRDVIRVVISRRGLFALAGRVQSDLRRGQRIRQSDLRLRQRIRQRDLRRRQRVHQSDLRRRQRLHESSLR